MQKEVIGLKMKCLMKNLTQKYRLLKFIQNKNKDISYIKNIKIHQTMENITVMSYTIILFFNIKSYFVIILLLLD